MQIENPIADGDTDVEALAMTEDSIRQVLNRKSEAGSFADASQLFSPIPAPSNRSCSYPGRFRDAIGRDEAFFQTLPAFKILVLQNSGLHGELRGAHG